MRADPEAAARLWSAAPGPGPAGCSPRSRTGTCGNPRRRCWTPARTRSPASSTCASSSVGEEGGGGGERGPALGAVRPPPPGPGAGGSRRPGAPAAGGRGARRDTPTLSLGAGPGSPRSSAPRCCAQAAATPPCLGEEFMGQRGTEAKTRWISPPKRCCEVSQFE